MSVRFGFTRPVQALPRPVSYVVVPTSTAEAPIQLATEPYATTSALLNLQASDFDATSSFQNGNRQIFNVGDMSTLDSQNVVGLKVELTNTDGEILHYMLPLVAVPDDLL